MNNNLKLTFIWSFLGLMFLPTALSDNNLPNILKEALHHGVKAGISYSNGAPKLDISSISNLKGGLKNYEKKSFKEFSKDAGWKKKDNKYAWRGTNSRSKYSYTLSLHPSSKTDKLNNIEYFVKVIADPPHGHGTLSSLVRFDEFGKVSMLGSCRQDEKNAVCYSTDKNICQIINNQKDKATKALAVLSDRSVKETDLSPEIKKTVFALSRTIASHGKKLKNKIWAQSAGAEKNEIDQLDDAIPVIPNIIGNDIEARKVRSLISTCLEQPSSFWGRPKYKTPSIKTMLELKPRNYVAPSPGNHSLKK